ncbi:MAG: hypothetical protein AB7O32_16310 [Vicinamibacterales bacterium]
MNVYLFTHPFTDAPAQAALLRLNALRALRDELSGLPGVRVSPMPQGADLEVEITNVIASEEPPAAIGRDASQRILVVRMGRNGERLDFVCSDGRGDSTAERQAARRIRNWVLGQELCPVAMTPAQELPLRAIA